MNRVLLVLPLIALAACTASPAPEPTPPPTPAPPTTTAAVDATAPPAPEATADGPCPYLDDAEVADANGQRVGDVRVSAGDPPSCFFSRSDGNIQLTVRVHVGEDPAVATAVVDEAAPVAESNPARSPAGWSGGSLSGDDGAVYAVAKGSTAIVVTTNQEQTIKARRITETVIGNLGL